VKLSAATAVPEMAKAKIAKIFFIEFFLLKDSV
jgi:hypothetical protein